MDDLIAGLAAGVPAAFFTCPLDVIKTRMQSCGVVRMRQAHALVLVSRMAGHLFVSVLWLGRERARASGLGLVADSQKLAS